LDATLHTIINSFLAAWFYGLLIVTAASFLSPLAILTVPLLSKSLYDRCMIFLVALGVGAMSGSCFFILIPQGFNITELQNVDYWTKSWLMASALYGFFVVDRLLQCMLEFRRRRKTKSGKVHTTTSTNGPALAEMLSLHHNGSINMHKAMLNGSVVREETELVDGEIVEGIRVEDAGQGDEICDEYEVEMSNNRLARTLSTRHRYAVRRKFEMDQQPVETVNGEWKTDGGEVVRKNGSNEVRGAFYKI